jgi:hypothetical protein
MNRLIAALILVAVTAGCALKPENEHHAGIRPTSSLPRIPAFSANSPGGLPSGWEPVVILRTKKPTKYQLVAERGRTILHAKAEGASSGLMHEVSIDPIQHPWLNWKWKIASLVHTADNFHGHTEDSPVRIVLGFDGDKESLPFADQILFETAKLLSGHDFPYATLMYIWENKAPVGTIIPNGRSKRIQKVVAASGPDGVGQWHEFTRNIVKDYENAFGETPGKLIRVGVLTDTDNTGETVEAWYGDLRLLSPPLTP